MKTTSRIPLLWQIQLLRTQDSLSHTTVTSPTVAAHGLMKITLVLINALQLKPDIFGYYCSYFLWAYIIIYPHPSPSRRNRLLDPLFISQETAFIGLSGKHVLPPTLSSSLLLFGPQVSELPSPIHSCCHAALTGPSFLVHLRILQGCYSRNTLTQIIFSALRQAFICTFLLSL